MNEFLAIDLFSGAGGLALGIEQAGFKIVLANEIRRDFADSYALNHPTTKLVVGDIKNLSPRTEAGDANVSLLFGGPPCQGFSTIGKKDRNDDRNSLFWQFIRISEEVNPDFVLFENVSGFKRMYSGAVYNTLIDELSKCGYSVCCSILDCSKFGVPQRRKRTIVVGHKPEFKFSMPEGNEEAISMWDAISDLPAVASGETATCYLCEPLNQYQKKMRGEVDALTEHVAPTHGKRLLDVIRHVPAGGSILDVPLDMRPKGYYLNTYARLFPGEPAPTITRNFGTPSSSRCIHPYQDRGLTTREGARLQGFPDWYLFSGSRSSKNLQIGNAVPPALGFAVGMAIHASLENS